MASEEETIKLNDEKKLKLIEFYKENKELWTTNFSRTSRNLKKSKLHEHFEGKFQLETLEKAFHGLKSSFLRELKSFRKEIYQKGNGSSMIVCYFLKKSKKLPPTLRMSLQLSKDRP